MTDRPRGTWYGSIIRTPLLTKLVLLDMAINAIALLVMQLTAPEHAEFVTVLSLAVVLVLNGALVAWALSPLRVLEETTRRVSEGDFAARAEMPPIADRNLARIGRTLNALIDRVTTERGRVRALAVELVATGDRERAHIARELHDGTAQSLSALDMLLASTLDDPVLQAGPVRDRLVTMREIVVEALAEVRALAQNVHPRVLDDLGLPAALEFLARRSGAPGGPKIEIRTEIARVVPVPIAAVLYRVGQEALHNAVRHARATTVSLDLRVTEDTATLRVADNGTGFDRQAVGPGRGGLGLFVMEERVSLVDGMWSLESRAGEHAHGTEIVAVIPLGPVPLVPEPS